MRCCLRVDHHRVAVARTCVGEAVLAFSLSHHEGCQHHSAYSDRVADCPVSQFGSCYLVGIGVMLVRTEFAQSLQVVGGARLILLVLFNLDVARWVC